MILRRGSGWTIQFGIEYGASLQFLTFDLLVNFIQTILGTLQYAVDDRHFVLDVDEFANVTVELR